MPVPPLNLSADEKLKPPQRKFALGEGASDGDHEINRTSHHSRTTSVSFTESPPITPRSITFNNAVTPFTPVTNQAYYTPEQTPGTTPNIHQEGNAFPFPDITSSSSSIPRTGSGFNSVSTSLADLNRNAQAFYGQRPQTGDSYSPGSRPMSARSREAFASPRARPTTMYSTVQPSITKVQRERPKSTMLAATTSLQKPWLKARDPYQRISYFVTYAFMFLGVALGAVRCYFGWFDVPILSGNLCPVLIEDFDSETGVFGDNGKFFREVDMSGFG